MRQDIREVIDRLKPLLRGDGGELELVESVDDDTITVRMTGLCSTCDASLWTHRLRIERAIHQVMPEAKVVFLLG